MAERDDLALELQQHDATGILHWFELDRRDFLKVVGGGLLVCAAAPAALAQESGRRRGGQDLPQDIESWLHIAPDGNITVMTGKVEMGQNIRTSLTQAVSEELRAPIALITLIMGDTGLTPFDMGTFGSRTTPTMAPQLRAVAATAREMLIDAAAAKWKVDRSTLTAAVARVTNTATNQSIGYGELTRGEKLVGAVSTSAAEVPAARWTLLGQPVAKLRGRDFVTGKHQYPSDIERPGMMFGKVVRPAGFKSKLVSLDTKTAEEMPGVKVVLDGDFIGVVAADAHTAERAAKAVIAQWDIAPGQPSNANLFEYLKQNVESGRGGDTRPNPSAAGQKGDVEQALAASDIKLKATYTVQYIAHAPLEPRAAVAEWNGDKVTVWHGGQRPFAVRDDIAEALRLSPANVRVLVPDTGSAYGGKHTGEAAIEAARLARAAGKPVRLVWTREEEFTWAYARPAGVIEVRSGAQKDGTLTAWDFHNYNSGPAGIDTRYNVANVNVQYHPVNSPLRQGSYRGLAATANFFARESHMDELAHAANMDPLEFRLKNLTDPRLRAVFQAAAERFGWGKPKSASTTRGFGIAGGFEKLGYVATCVEVEIGAARQVHVRRIVEAFECGAVVNPNGLRNQVEGAIVQGIGGALFEAIDFAGGKVLNPHFRDYRLPRFRDVPPIEVVILDRKDLPSAGAGETPIMGLAPAIANAIFAATGTRLRALPLLPNGTVPA